MDKTFKPYRFETNPKEKEMIDKFEAKINIIESRIFGDLLDGENKLLSDREEKIVYSTIQWLGTPVGQNYLKSCGFKLEE